MPRSNNIHKSMLLRGVHFPPRTLDRSDIEATKTQASRSGRSFGGAPLRGGHSNGRGRGGQMNYANDRPNPFAPYVDPQFVPPPPASYSRGPPPGAYFNDYDRPHPPSHAENVYYHGSQRPSRTQDYPPPPSRDYGYGPRHSMPDSHQNYPPTGYQLRYGNQQGGQSNGHPHGWHNGNGYGYGSR